MKISTKSSIWAFVAILVALALLEGPNGAQSKKQDDFEKMKFEVAPDKDSYILLEPIRLKFKFSNQTSAPVTTFQPFFIHESKLIIFFNGETRVFNDLSSINGIPAVRFPIIFKPQSLVSDEKIFNPAFVGAFFPVAGDYKLQFILRSADGEKSIQSNVLDIRIEEPAGIDRDALDFLRRNEKYFGLSSWVFSDKEGTELLEQFVRRYGRSIYGDFGISGLAYTYLGQSKLDKAKAEFEKLKDSEHKTIAEDARRNLVDIEKRKAELEKAKLPK